MPKLSKVDELIHLSLSEAYARGDAWPLFGSKTTTGFFPSAAKAMKEAAHLAIERGYIRGTGEFIGKGKSRKEIYCLTQEGAEFSVAHDAGNAVLQGLLDALDRMNSQLTEISSASRHQKSVVEEISKRRATPPVKPAKVAGSTADLSAVILRVIEEHERRDSLGLCPLPAIYREIQRTSSVTIGDYHNALREMVAQGKIVLQPYTGPMYRLEEGETALVAGQEIKYYAQSRRGS